MVPIPDSFTRLRLTNLGFYLDLLVFVPRQMAGKAQGERGNCQGWVALARSREDGRRQKIEIGTIESSQVSVRHGVFGAVAHSRGSDLMRAMSCNIKNGLSISFPRLTVFNLSDSIFDQPFLDTLVGPNDPIRVVLRESEVDHKAGHAQTVSLFRKAHHAVAFRQMFGMI